MNTPPDLDLILTFSVITYFLYIINKYTDIEDQFQKEDDIHFFRNHPCILVVSFILLFISIVDLVIKEKFNICHFVVIVAGVAYSIKIVPVLKKRKLELIRLKDVFLIKSVTVAMIWGFSMFAINWCEYPNLIDRTQQILLLSFVLTLSIFVNTIFADVRDYYGDSIAGIRTVPVCVGIRNTYVFFMYLPILCILVILFLSFFLCHIEKSVFLLSLLISSFPVIYIWLFERKICNCKVISYLADSDVVFFSLGLFLIGKFSS